MKKRKIKKIALNIFAISQIFFLTLGSAPIASASWASLRYDIDEDEVPAGIKDEGEYEVAATYKKSDQTPRVSVIFSPANPKAGEKVTATATATPFANDEENLYYTWFLKREGCDVEGDDKNKYAVSSTDFDPDDDYPNYGEILAEDPEAAACDADKDGMVTVNDWKVEAGRIAVQNGFKPDMGSRYSTLDEFYSEDTDGDGYRTWQGGADAERMPNHCYGYDATSGIMFEYLDQYLDGAPMCPDPNGSDEKVPAVCGRSVTWYPATATADTCNCGGGPVTEADGTWRTHAQCNNCIDGTVHNLANITSNSIDPYTRTAETNDNPLADPPGPGDLLTAHTTTTWPHIPASCSSGGANEAYSDCPASEDGVVQWYECMIDTVYCHPTPGATYSGGVGGSDYSGHCDCGTQSELSACEKQSSTPRCEVVTSGDHIGEYAAVCGNSGTGIDSDEAQVNGIAMCPTASYKIFNGATPFFNYSESDLDSIQAATKILTYNTDSYVYSDGARGAYSPYDNLPACGCGKIREEMNNPTAPVGQAYTGTSDAPLCADRSPEIDDLLCGSLTTSSGAENDVTKSKEQFHVFPQRLSNRTDGIATQTYYDLTRDYAEGSDEKYTYVRGNNTGNDSFGLVDERYWGTDPRNESTAQNGKYDEANLAGLGAATFTWTFAAGDSVGVAVEGTSNIGTKFPDSSRMIMWAFSKGVDAATNSSDEADVACQPRYSGSYDFFDFTNMQNVGLGIMLPDVLSMPTGFMDFDRCLEKSTVPIVAGGGADGAQPKAMEVELSATPSKPLNDETGEGKGDVVDVQAIIIGATGTENELSYSWTIKGIAPEIGDDDLSVAPATSDWDSEDATICDENSASCPFRDGSGGKLPLSGIGNSEISFKLDIASSGALYSQTFNENGDGYFKVMLEARESDELSDPPNSRSGYGEVILKVSSSRNRITVFRPVVNNNLLSSQGSISFCESGEERSICPVMENDIVGLTVPAATLGAGSGNSETLDQFQWFLDGSAINDCDREMSNECENGKSTNVAFIPVIGEKGDTFTVSVKASNISGGSDTGTQTGKAIDLSRQFEIVDPSIKIVSADDDQVWPKLIGSSVDPTLDDDDAGKYTDDYSKSILETAEGNNAELKLEYTPSFLGDLGLAENWQIDGASNNASGGTAGFTAGTVGTIHNASASVVYSQSTEMNRALNNLFGVAKSDLTSQTMSDSIQVEVNEARQASAFKNPTRFMANLLSKVPAQILFLIRLLLSISMTIVLAGVIFAFFPETAYDKRRS